jgi:hypothetical protein
VCNHNDDLSSYNYDYSPPLPVRSHVDTGDSRWQRLEKVGSVCGGQRERHCGIVVG